MIGVGISIRQKVFGKNFIIVQKFLKKSPDGGHILNSTGGKIIINTRQTP